MQLLPAFGPDILLCAGTYDVWIILLLSGSNGKLNKAMCIIGLVRLSSGYTAAGFYCYGIKGRDGMAPPCARCKHMSKRCVDNVGVDENSDDDVVVLRPVNVGDVRSVMMGKGRGGRGGGAQARQSGDGG